jgi:hypothetical protein
MILCSGCLLSGDSHTICPIPPDGNYDDSADTVAATFFCMELRRSSLKVGILKGNTLKLGKYLVFQYILAN